MKRILLFLSMIFLIAAPLAAAAEGNALERSCIFFACRDSDGMSDADIAGTYMFNLANSEIATCPLIAYLLKMYNCKCKLWSFEMYLFLVDAACALRENTQKPFGSALSDLDCLKTKIRNGTQAAILGRIVEAIEAGELCEYDLDVLKDAACYAFHCSAHDCKEEYERWAVELKARVNLFGSDVESS